MAYIANKPVRFDKDYKVGEIIPNDVVDLSAEKRLIAWGKITKTENMTENMDNTQSADSTENEESTQSADSAENEDGVQSVDSNETKNSSQTARKTDKNKKSAKG